MSQTKIIFVKGNIVYVCEYILYAKTYKKISQTMLRKLNCIPLFERTCPPPVHPIH